MGKGNLYKGNPENKSILLLNHVAKTPIVSRETGNSWAQPGGVVPVVHRKITIVCTFVRIVIGNVKEDRAIN